MLDLSSRPHQFPAISFICAKVKDQNRLTKLFRHYSFSELLAFMLPIKYLSKYFHILIFRSDTNCQKYFLCIEGRPRGLACGGDAAFDDLTSTCVSADEVAACPQELRTAAARARDDEKQLLAKELEFNARTLNKVRRPF